MTQLTSTTRFSGRVENYVLYRPRYPAEVLRCLQTDCGLTAEAIVADLGSGTGFLAEIFLKNGNRLFGIEPNKEMRQAAEAFLHSFPRFISIDGTAEATTLPDASVDFVMAGQAFHWFDRDLCRVESKRILRPGGWVVLIWNDRRTDSTPFLAAYEQLLQTYGTDYRQVDHKRIDATVLREFFEGEPVKRNFPNYQHFDFSGLKGRLLSSSYVPDTGQPGYEQMLNALKKLFDEHQNAGTVTFEYDTLLYYGRLTS